MAQKKNKPKERQIGKKQIQKKYLIDPRYKNAVWTAVIVIILTIFFIINNTRSVPEHGPYPPNYNPSNRENPTKNIDHDLYGADLRNNHNNLQE